MRHARRCLPQVQDSEGKEIRDGVTGRGGGYRYFGAAKQLPGVRELFEKEPPRKVMPRLSTFPASDRGPHGRHIAGRSRVCSALERRSGGASIIQGISGLSCRTGCRARSSRGQAGAVRWAGPGGAQVRRTRHDMYKFIDADYYGFRDEEDGVLAAAEGPAEKAMRAEVGGPPDTFQDAPCGAAACARLADRILCRVRPCCASGIWFLCRANVEIVMRCIFSLCIAADVHSYSVRSCLGCPCQAVPVCQECCIPAEEVLAPDKGCKAAVGDCGVGGQGSGEGRRVRQGGRRHGGRRGGRLRARLYGVRAPPGAGGNRGPGALLPHANTLPFFLLPGPAGLTCLFYCRLAQQALPSYH